MTAVSIALLILLFIAFVTDLKNRKIYNWLTIPCIILGFLLNYAAGGTLGLKSSIFGFITGSIIFLFFFAFGYIGGGDAKLISAIGSLGGFPFIINAMIFSGLAGGIIAVVVLIKKRCLRQTLWNILIFFYFFLHPIRSKIPMPSNNVYLPYGAVICVGTVIALILDKTCII